MSRSSSVWRGLGAALLAALAATVRPAAAQSASVVGVVYDSLITRAALADAQVNIIELGRIATTDKRGRFRFDSVKAGTYTITFLHPALDSADVSAPELQLVVPAAGTVVTPLATPSPATTYSRLCGMATESKMGAIYGRVRSAADGKPAPGTRVFGTWLDFLLVGTRVKRSWREQGVVTGKNGEFILCGIPTDVAVDIRAAHGVLAAGPVQVQAGEAMIAHIDFTVPVADSGARMLAGDSGRALRPDSAPPPGSSVLTGTVREHDGKPIADALVGVMGFSMNARTSATGQFALTRVPAGTRTVQVRALGATPRNVTIDFPENQRFEMVITLEKRPPTLATVAVQGTKDGGDIPHSSTGFASRRKLGTGRYVTGDDIRKYGAMSLVDAIMIAPGVRREWSSMGPSVSIRGSKGQCTPSMYLDGMNLSTGERGAITELEQFIRPEAITGIEVYPGPFIPPQFDRTSVTGCGSIVIWTRR
ncbi:MAG: carboxypeptidase regulatory-like domain-containing protein [Gemmatimonadetes bacterium]|nr:carboxypeptidase regulatory-like domain-containing protein [Gemmatimonadota bacterium]